MTRIPIACLAPILVAIADVVFRVTVSERSRTGTASQRQPLVFAIANAVVSLATVISRIVVVKHRYL